jgi:hypothetical protein
MATTKQQPEVLKQTGMPSPKRFGKEDIRKRYENLTSSVIAHCQFTTELVGGQSAERAGIESWVKHHLKLSGEEAEKAVRRILDEEVGTRPVPSEEGELDEKLTYGLNVIRWSDAGPWLGNWMVGACLKQAASRLGIFAKKRGSKGDLTEMAEVYPVGDSLIRTVPVYQQKIHLTNGKGPLGRADTFYQQFKGRVQTAKGSASIVNDCECAPPGTRFSFQLRFYPGKVTEDDILDIFSAASVIGLGSCKAYEKGKFEVNELIYNPGKLRKKGEVSLDDEDTDE